MPLPGDTRPSILTRLARFVLRHPGGIVAAWLGTLLLAAPVALRLGAIAQGGSEAIRGSEAHAVMTTLEREFGAGFAHLVPVVFYHEQTSTAEPAFAAAVDALARQLSAAPGTRAVLHPWNCALPGLIGRDGRTVLLLVQPDAATLAEAEAFTAPLRGLLAPARLPPGFHAVVTGMSAAYHDINHQSARDLLRAELVGVPLTLLVLFLVFRTAVAAGLALGVAVAGVTLSSAVLWLLSPWLPVSVLAQNVITMIGLGAGTDYALFLLSHLRSERDRGAARDEAIVRAIASAGPAIVVAGLAVATGFGALFLVNARFVHSLAAGGAVVVVTCVAATLSLLPALLHFAGDRVFRRTKAQPSSPASAAISSGWDRWARSVMARPWAALGLAGAISVAFAWPATRVRGWTVGPADLSPQSEARVGAELLAQRFHAGWLAPLVMTLETGSPGGVWTVPGRRAALDIMTQLERDPRIAEVLGYPRLLPAIDQQLAAGGPLPPAVLSAAGLAVTADGKTALVLAITHAPPSNPETIALVGELRAQRWPAAHAAGLRVRVGGGAALIRDFDREMVASVSRVMLVVLGATGGLLLIYFRSLAVPLKAILANVLSVLSAYGFLVLLFQDGVGAHLFGITPPGGLNSFVVLMLFTILFGLSMDYEIFLLSRIRQEYLVHPDNTTAVARGLAGTAGIITSAAAIMVCLFGSFGFFGLTASRQFGLGLAFAVAFDATVVRLLIVPATMRLLGAWNWWLPSLRGKPARATRAEACAVPRTAPR